MTLATVAVPVPFLDPLTYRVPPGMALVRGARVVVPLGRRLVTGLVVAVQDGAAPPPGQAPETLRDVHRVLDTTAFLPDTVVDLALWIADYYLCAPGEALAAAMPPLAWIESEREWTVTEAGIVAAGTGDLSRGARAALDALADGRGRDLGALVRAVSTEPDERERDRLERTLRQLERDGLVAVSHRMVGRADASKTERIVTPTVAAADAVVRRGLTVRQLDALDAIVDAVLMEGTLPTARLDAIGVTPAVLAALVKKEVVRFDTQRVSRAGDPREGLLADEAEPLADGGHAHEPTPEQAEALRRLTALADEATFRPAVLHGVTGSGKTEVYRRLALRVCERGRRVLILVPEIALTPAVAARFRATFGERVAILHSALSDGERHDQWQRIRAGDVDVVVGTRSAVFAPIEPLGLLIVDEEQDTSYKQEDSPRYHGRDVAVVRARNAGALVVLGSATPSLETYQHALAGRYTLVSMTRRVLDRPLADVQVVNMRDELAEAGPDVVLSAALREGLAARLQEREQAILLLNRRGYASNVFCRQCGDTLQCPNCSVSLTVHRGARRARCHYCDFSRRLPEQCVSCGAAYLEYQGVGTERVEAEVQALFPDARVARVDRDTVRRRGEITRVLRRFARREIDVLVGTQMIAKGHDFPAVTLVGVISADVGLGLADFRAGERTFQLLTQVAGRAGRGERAGEAIIQTLFPDHYSIQLARQQDYPAFFDRESQYRQSMRYPPAVSLVNVVVRGRSEQDARTDAQVFADALRDRPGFKVLGPAPAPLARLRGQHRVQMFLKGSHRLAMRQALRDALGRHPRLARQISIDVDPLSVL